MTLRQLALAGAASVALASCATQVPINSTPPIEWTEPVAEPLVPAGNSDAEAGGYIISLHDALRAANNKLRRLREWAESMKD